MSVFYIFISSLAVIEEMTVDSDRDYLCNKEEKHKQQEMQNCTTTTTLCCNEKEEPSTDVWTDIADALNHWTQKVLDVEVRHSKTANLRENIEDSLRRQQQPDGFLNDQDIDELRYIADLWTNLLNSISSYTIGCEFVKRDIITFLLELYKLRQITDCLFIETCLKL